MKWLGMDIGGAHLKLADGDQYAEYCAFPLWREPDQLTQQLRMRIASAPDCDHLAVTMTGELADCFATKSEGVCFILDAVEQAADRRHTRVYLSDGRMVTPVVARRKPALVASANWHALARFAGRLAPSGSALVIDLGSTTTDLVPLRDGAPAARGQTDVERLVAGELVYCGVERTPLCAIVSEAPYRGRTVPLARELFATLQDVYVLLGDLNEDTQAQHTADGRPATKGAARARLRRMFCLDADQFHHRDAVVAARAVADVHEGMLRDAVLRILDSPEAMPGTAVLAGQGEFLARRILRAVCPAAEIVSLARHRGGMLSRCGPAYALAVLAREVAE